MVSIHRVEVTPKQIVGLRDVRGDVVRRTLLFDHDIMVDDVRSTVGFLIKANISEEQINRLIEKLNNRPPKSLGIKTPNQAFFRSQSPVALES